MCRSGISERFHAGNSSVCQLNNVRETVLTCPQAAAAWIGCHPSLSVISKSASCSTRKSMTFVQPLAAAT